MATKTETGEKPLSMDELKRIAPDLFDQFVEAARKREQEKLLMSTYVEAVSGAIHAAAAALAKYRDAYSELQAELGILKEKGGSVTMVPEYREYRKDNGQEATGKGKPSNIELVVEHFMPKPEDVD